MTEEQNKEGLSNVGKIVGVNLIAAVIYMGLQTIIDGIFMLALMHGLLAAVTGLLMLFSKKTRSAGAAMILAGIIIFMVGFSLCAGSIRIH